MKLKGNTIKSVIKYIFLYGFFFFLGLIIGMGIYIGVKSGIYREVLKTARIGINYWYEKFNGKYYDRFNSEKGIEDNFYDLLLLNERARESKEIKSDLVDTMVLLGKYRMAGYVVESELKKMVDEDEYREEYFPLLSYIYFKAGDIKKSESYFKGYVSQLKKEGEFKEGKGEIEEKLKRYSTGKNRYFDYKRDYYKFLIDGFKKLK